MNRTQKKKLTKIALKKLVPVSTHSYAGHEYTGYLTPVEVLLLCNAGVRLTFRLDMAMYESMKRKGITQPRWAYFSYVPEELKADLTFNDSNRLGRV